MGVVSVLAVLVAAWAGAEAQGFVRNFGGAQQVNVIIQCGREFCDTRTSQCECPSPRSFGNGLSRGQSNVIIVLSGNSNRRCRCIRNRGPIIVVPSGPVFNPGQGGGSCGFRRNGTPRFCNPFCQRCDFFNERCINRRISGCRRGRRVGFRNNRFRNDRRFNRRFQANGRRFQAQSRFDRRFSNRFSFDETSNSTNATGPQPVDGLAMDTFGLGFGNATAKGIPFTGPPSVIFAEGFKLAKGRLEPTFVPASGNP